MPCTRCIIDCYFSIKKATTPTTSEVRFQTPTDAASTATQKETRRATEDRLAVIFLVIILGFIFCHLPRVGIDVHEILTLEHSNMCKEAKMPNIFPAWSFVGVYVSHFCLAINATMNMLIYCFMSPMFREEVVQVLQSVRTCGGKGNSFKNAPGADHGKRNLNGATTTIEI